MLSNQQLVELMINEPSWEDVIVKIIAEEGIDPWNIDIIKLADTFTEYLGKMQKIDLRIPARFILIAAILVRMKSDILVAKKEKKAEEGEKPPSELTIELSKVPPLEPPIKRAPLGNVTIDELVTALKKAFEVKERRIKKKLRIKRMVERAVPPAEEDITERINNLLKQIESAIKDIEENLEFSKLVKNWNREEIVKALMPALHLSQDGKINISQEELFQEIYLKLKKRELKK